MKKSKIITKISIICCMLLTISFFSSSYANEKTINKDNINITSITDKNELNIKQNTLSYNNTKLELYKTFKNNDNELQNIKRTSPNLLRTLSIIYGLDELNSSNWEKYRDAMYSSLGKHYNESYIEFHNLRDFFDIYENEEKNCDIINYIENNRGKVKALDSLEFKLLLPYDDNNKCNILNNDINITSKFVDDCVYYATTYATSRHSEYESFSRDCTNFMSQILEHAGVQQDIYSDENKGWWHNYIVGYFNKKTHYHSKSCINADVFCKYMGVTYTTTNNNSFSKNIQKGDFVACDFKNDKDWDHMGFVVAKDSSVGTYDGMKYYDYKIAQHTSDYNLWASNSKNNWDKVGTDGGKYARVRR